MNVTPLQDYPHPSGRQLSTAFATVLQSERELLNSRFAAQSHSYAGIDGQAFLYHLAEVVDPIVDAVDQILPECTRTVAIELFDLSLGLFGANAIGPAATSVVPQV